MSSEKSRRKSRLLLRPSELKILCYILCQGLASGYEIGKALKMPESTVYTALKFLERRGFVTFIEEEKAGPLKKKIYRLTPKGLQEALSYIPREKEVWDNELLRELISRESGVPFESLKFKKDRLLENWDVIMGIIRKKYREMCPIIFDNWDLISKHLDLSRGEFLDNLFYSYKDPKERTIASFQEYFFVSLVIKPSEEEKTRIEKFLKEASEIKPLKDILTIAFKELEERVERSLEDIKKIKTRLSQSP